MITEMICPNCHSAQLAPISGRETVYQEGFQCPKCGTIIDVDDEEPKTLSIGDIPREGNIHLQITICDSRLYETTLTRVRSGAWIVTENGAHLLRTGSESEAVAKLLKTPC